MSNVSKHVASIEKFDGTNWEDWAYSVRGHFHLMHTLRIAEGTKIHPKLVRPTPTKAESRAMEDWDRRNDEGLGLIQLSIKNMIRQSIK
jgi:gag-polypeptide of LTR copia-type